MKIEYTCTGASTKTDACGMREMQARAFGKRAEQYLLLKAPPASGKSRALMYIALDKLAHQGIRKAIVAVPERAIGASFAEVRLTRSGFFADWVPDPRYNLCTPGADAGKVARFREFLESDARILICTHATLRFAFEQSETADFCGTLLAIDEFHHVSADQDNSRLGKLLHRIMAETDAHVVAMTGSYFRGDNVPILLPEDEARFSRVVYNYYDQLNGYTYLKSLGIGYHFYEGTYLESLASVLDTDKKTIIHIPNVNSAESTGDKMAEVGHIMSLMGDVDHDDPETGLTYIRRKDGRLLKVADLVDDIPAHRDKLVGYLRRVKKPEDLDIIIALGMAKEGFDWPMCEHALTVGYRGSLTEIVQIIGRATRDYPGKEHTQFTNLVAAPRAKTDAIVLSVNNMLKAITASLLMEQVLAPDFSFLNRVKKGEIHVEGYRKPGSKRVEDIIANDLTDLKAQVLQDETVQKVLASPEIDPHILNKVLLPKLIAKRYDDLTNDEVEEVRQALVLDNLMHGGKMKEERTADGAIHRFLTFGDRFINVGDLSINLIDSINPFCTAFEILAKQLTAPTLRLIQEAIAESKITLAMEDVPQLWPSVEKFYHTNNRWPDPNARQENEALLGQVLTLLRKFQRTQTA